MKRLIALFALGIGTAALAQTPPPAPVAKKVIVHKKVHTRTHTKTVTHRPSVDGVAHTNVAVKHTVVTPNSVHTKTVTKTSTKTPSN